MIYTCIVQPQTVQSESTFYGDVESFNYIRVLRGYVQLQNDSTVIRLRNVRFSVMYTERISERVVIGNQPLTYGLTAQPIEQLPYMIHFTWLNNVPRREHQSVVLKVPHAQVTNNNHEGYPSAAGNPVPSVFNIMHQGTYAYSTHASLKSYFQFVSNYKDAQIVGSTQEQKLDQAQWYYEVERDVVLHEESMFGGTTLEFEIVMTNCRGKRVGDRFLPPVEVEFEIL